MKCRVAVLLAVISCLFFSVASACTLFAANGEAYVDGGGTIIAKTRDWPFEFQTIRLVDDGPGFRYYGLFSEDRLNVAAGVNEMGLVVVSASAGSIPRKQRLQEERYQGLNKRLLSRYAAVDEVLRDLHIFKGSRFIMLADKEKIAYVEIGPREKPSVTVKSNGVLAHTNHFINTDMAWANEKIRSSSAIRYQRITQLLTGESRPFTLDQFIRFSEDKTAGPNDSIWRDGEKPRSVQTIAAFIVHLPRSGTPIIYCKMRTSPDAENSLEVYRKSFSDIFSQAKTRR